MLKKKLLLALSLVILTGSNQMAFVPLVPFAMPDFDCNVPSLQMIADARKYAVAGLGATALGMLWLVKISTDLICDQNMSTKPASKRNPILHPACLLPSLALLIGGALCIAESANIICQPYGG